MTLIEKAKIEIFRRDYINFKEDFHNSNKLRNKLKKEIEKKKKKKSKKITKVEFSLENQNYSNNNYSLNSSVTLINSSLSDNEEYNLENSPYVYRKNKIKKVMSVERKLNNYKNSNFKENSFLENLDTIYIYKKIVYFDKKGFIIIILFKIYFKL